MQDGRAHMRRAVGKCCPVSSLCARPRKTSCSFWVDLAIGYPAAADKELQGLVFAALTACKNLRDLQSGKRLHSRLSVRDIYSATSLVDMYAKCGSMVDARIVFDRVPCYDLALLNVVILGYADNGDGNSALQFFESLESQGDREADSRTYVAAITACSSLAAVEVGTDVCGKLVKVVSLGKGMAIHSEAATRSEDGNIFVGNSLIDMYANCGSLLDARAAFDRMLLHDLVSWNSLIVGYVENGNSDLALQLFSAAEEEGCVPDTRTCVAALRACGNMAEAEKGKKVCGKVVKVESLKQGRSVHRQAERNGFLTNLYVANSLIDMYGKCGSVKDAETVFRGMQKRNVVSWTAMMLGYAEGGEADLALRLFSSLRSEGCLPDARTYAAVLMVCGSLVALETGRGIHREICKSGLGEDAFLGNCLVDFYAKCGSMEEAEEVFCSIRFKNVVTWTSLIAGYGHLGDTDSVFRLFHRMRGDDLKPNGVTLVSVLTACSHSGLVETGKEYFDGMVSQYGVARGIEHYHCLVDMLGRANLLDSAMKVVETMPFEADEVTWKTVLSSCRKWRNLSLGRVAFEALLKLDEKDSTVYMLMADLFARTGMWEDQQEVLAMKKKSGAYKKAGKSWWTDDAGSLHSFKAGDLNKLTSLREFEEFLERMKVEGGYSADISSVMHNIGEAEKEDALCGHSEKLAIVYALLETPPGRLIRIAKNLRVCDDCHRFTAVVSKVEGRCIVCRDASRFHVFQDGKCSCGDFW